MKANNGTPQFAEEMKPTTLPCGPHPGFGKLVSKPNVFRCRLRPELNKKKLEHADYAGTLQLDNGQKALVRLWVHADSSLGLRLELPEKRKAAP